MTEVKATGSLQPDEDEEDDEDADPEEQAKLINEQFQHIYDNDP
jgi:hypothetical protein